MNIICVLAIQSAKTNLIESFSTALFGAFQYIHGSLCMLHTVYTIHFFFPILGEQKGSNVPLSFCFLRVDLCMELFPDK